MTFAMSVMVWFSQMELRSQQSLDTSLRNADEKLVFEIDCYLAAIDHVWIQATAISRPTRLALSQLKCIFDKRLSGFGHNCFRIRLPGHSDARLP